MFYIRVHLSENTLKQKFLEKESVIKRASLEPLWLGTALWALILLSSFAFYSPSSPPATLSSLSQLSLLCEPLLPTHAPSLLQAASLSVGWPTIKLNQAVSSLCFTRSCFFFCLFGLPLCWPQWILRACLVCSQPYSYLLYSVGENISKHNLFVHQKGNEKKRLFCKWRQDNCLTS